MITYPDFACCNEPCADEPKREAGSSLTSKAFRTKMHTANAATASKPACEPVSRAHTIAFLLCAVISLVLTITKHKK